MLTLNINSTIKYMNEFIKRLTSKRSLFIKILIASFLVNLLALATPIYVIQVLQRYIAYGVTSTLFTLVIGVSFIVILSFLETSDIEWLESMN